MDTEKQEPQKYLEEMKKYKLGPVTTPRCRRAPQAESPVGSRMNAGSYELAGRLVYREGETQMYPLGTM